MTIRDAYTSWAPTYDQDRNLTRDLDAQVTRQILGKSHFQSILELGCGTGKNTELLARIGKQVLAFDFSEGMIERARQKIQASQVSFTATDITRGWPCPDRSVDLVVCNL